MCNISVMIYEYLVICDINDELVMDNATFLEIANIVDAAWMFKSYYCIFKGAKYFSGSTIFPTNQTRDNNNLFL